MKTKTTFSITPIIRRNKINKKGEVPIYLRITANGEISEISTKQFINPEFWDSSQGKVKGKSELVKTINETIGILALKAKKQYNKLLDNDKEITSVLIKDGALGLKNAKLSLLNFFDKMVKEVEMKVGNEFTKSTFRAYLASQKHIHAFVKDYLKLPDILLNNLNYQFIHDYELYLKSIGKCGQNGTVKHIYKLKKVINLALNFELLDKNPFARYSITKQKTLIQPLTEEELHRIINKDFSIERLNLIKDLFIFTCYTGLAFIDLKSLKVNNIGIGIDGGEWIFTERKKTGNQCLVPLLPPAKAIIEKYKQHDKVLGSGYILPVPSNQKFNAYLKEIGDICGIRKTLTVHIGRHTFATTVALENGVPMEAVKGMLGHDRITTTEIYAKVQVKLISDSMKILREKFKSSVQE